MQQIELDMKVKEFDRKAKQELLKEETALIIAKVISFKRNLTKQ